jgi:hypothetical protein
MWYSYELKNPSYFLPSPKVYLILEVLLFELMGIDAGRPWWEEGGFNRLTFS